MPFAGETIRASDILDRRGGTWSRVANQSIASGGAGSAISWDTEEDDTDGYLVPHATTGTTVTVPAGLGGLYTVTAAVVGAVAVRAFVDIVPVAATLVLPAQFREPIDLTEDRAVISATFPLDAADTFTIVAFQNSGAPVNFTGWLSAYRLGF